MKVCFNSLNNILIPHFAYFIFAPQILNYLNFPREQTFISLHTFVTSTIIIILNEIIKIYSFRKIAQSFRRVEVKKDTRLGRFPRVDNYKLPLNHPLEILVKGPQASYHRLNNRVLQLAWWPSSRSFRSNSSG